MPDQRLPGEPRMEPMELHVAPVRGSAGGDRRALAAALLIVAFLGLAIAKPWASSEPRPATPADASSRPAASIADGTAAAVTPSVLEAAWGPVPFVAGPPESVPATAVRSALRLHDGWGIRAVTGGPSGATLEERWISSTPERWVGLDTGGRSVLALGITAPLGVLVADVRVFVTVDGLERWLDVEGVGGGNPGSAVMLWPPRLGEAWAPAWPSGSYRFEVLTAGGVGDFGVELTAPDDASSDPRPGVRRWDGAAVTGFPALPATLGTGIFIGALPADAGPGTFAPAVMGLGGRSTAGLGYASGWIDTVAGQASQVSAYGVRAYAPTAVSIGVAAPAGMRVDDGKLVLLRPGLARGAVGGAERATGIIGQVGGPASGRQAIRFDQPDGRAWEPGTYAVVVDGVGPNGHDTVGYLLTLLPGSARSTAVPLAAIRAWARFAGQWGIAAGLLEPLDAPGRLAIRYAPTQPEATITGGADQGRRCLEVNLVDTALPILGIGHPVGVRPGAVEVQRIYLDGSELQARPATGLSMLPGLTLVAAPDGAGWAPGWYRLVVHTDSASVALPVCVGSATPGYLAVPANAGERAVAGAGRG